MTLLGFILHRLLTASALVAAVNIGLASPQGFCREGWTYAEKTHDCYRAVFEPKTWEGALKACQSWNATLPIIHDVDTDAALRDFAIKYVDAESFHIGLRRNASSGEWQWIDGSRVDYARWLEPLSLASPMCAFATFGLRSHYGRWRPVECNSWQRSHICVAHASGSSPTTSHSATSYEPLTNATAPRSTVTDETTREGIKTGKTCEDAVAAWKCKTLKTVYACKASKYISYPEKNCAKTCGFCT